MSEEAVVLADLVPSVPSIYEDVTSRERQAINDIFAMDLGGHGF